MSSEFVGLSKTSSSRTSRHAAQRSSYPGIVFTLIFSLLSGLLWWGLSTPSTVQAVGSPLVQEDDVNLIYETNYGEELQLLRPDTTSPVLLNDISTLTNCPVWFDAHSMADDGLTQFVAKTSKEIWKIDLTLNECSRLGNYSSLPANIDVISLVPGSTTSLVVADDSGGASKFLAVLDTSTGVFTRSHIVYENISAIKDVDVYRTLLGNIRVVVAGVDSSNDFISIEAFELLEDGTLSRNKRTGEADLLSLTNFMCEISARDCGVPKLDVANRASYLYFGIIQTASGTKRGLFRAEIGASYSGVISGGASNFGSVGGSFNGQGAVTQLLDGQDVNAIASRANSDMIYVNLNGDIVVMDTNDTSSYTVLASGSDSTYSELDILETPESSYGEYNIWRATGIGTQSEFVQTVTYSRILQDQTCVEWGLGLNYATEFGRGLFYLPEFAGYMNILVEKGDFDNNDFSLEDDGVYTDECYRLADDIADLVLIPASTASVQLNLQDWNWSLNLDTGFSSRNLDNSYFLDEQSQSNFWFEISDSKQVWIELSSLALWSNIEVEGFEFLGWSTQSSTVSPIVNTLSRAVRGSELNHLGIPVGNFSIFGQFQPLSNTLSFNVQGGSAVEDISYLTGATVSTVSIPTKSGYNFAGWFTQASGGTEVTFPYSPRVLGITVYAQWVDASAPAQSSQGTATTTTRYNGPVPNGFDPVCSPINQVSTTRLIGERLQGVYAAQIDGKPSLLSNVTSTSLQLVVPPLVSGKYEVTLFSNDGRLDYSNAFTICPEPTPTRNPVVLVPTPTRSPAVPATPTRSQQVETDPPVQAPPTSVAAGTQPAPKSSRFKIRTFIVSGFEFEKSQITNAVSSRLDIVSAKYMTKDFSGKILCRGYTGFNWNIRSQEFLDALALKRAEGVCGRLAKMMPKAQITVLPSIHQQWLNPLARKVVVTAVTTPSDPVLLDE